MRQMWTTKLSIFSCEMVLTGRHLQLLICMKVFLKSSGKGWEPDPLSFLLWDGISPPSSLLFGIQAHSAFPAGCSWTFCPFCPAAVGFSYIMGATVPELYMSPWLSTRESLGTGTPYISRPDGSNTLSSSNEEHRGHHFMTRPKFY